MPIKNWSVTPGSNVTAPPYGAPESSTKLKDVNDILRQMMADVRTMSASATVASAATCDLSTADEFWQTITGTTTITSFGTLTEGLFRFVTFSGALTLTHNATSLILLGGANRTTAAGDCALYLSLGGGNWKEYFYSPIAANTYQPLDDQLTTLAGITAQQATDLAAVSTFMGTVLNDTTADAVKATLEVGIQAKTANSYTATATLPSTDYGRAMFYNSATAGTLTLPDVAGNAAKIITIYNLGSGVCTVARAGTATIYAQGLEAATSITLNQGEGVQLCSDSTNWIQVGGTKNFGVGIGQVWTDVTASRALNTTYTNSTGKPISVSVQVVSTGGGKPYIVVAGSTIQAIEIAANLQATVSAIVPNGATYLVNNATATASIVANGWMELR